MTMLCAKRSYDIRTCVMFSFCGSKGMLILYVYREEDRKSNGDAEQNRRRDLSGKTKKKKKGK